jgi:hypothetical protein
MRPRVQFPIQPKKKKKRKEKLVLQVLHGGRNGFGPSVWKIPMLFIEVNILIFY